MTIRTRKRSHRIETSAWFWRLLPVTATALVLIALALAVAACVDDSFAEARGYDETSAA